MASRLQIKSRDRGAAALTKRIYGMGKIHLKVGIVGDSANQTYKDGTSVLMVAQWNEFGTPTIPARSFIRAWFDLHEAENKILMASALRAVARGAISKEAAMERLGQKFVAGIQARIADGVPPPNAPSTIKQKGSSTPLIDTGLLRSSITYLVQL